MRRGRTASIGAGLLVLAALGAFCAFPTSELPTPAVSDRPSATPPAGGTPTPRLTPTRIPTATPSPRLTAPTAEPAQTELDRLLAGKRGVHLSNRRLHEWDYIALEVLRPRWVVVLSAQLGETDPIGQVEPDPRLQQWLEQRKDVRPLVRMWTVKEPADPKELAARIVSLHQRYPWMEQFIPANEPDIEWADPSWHQIAQWTKDVWWNVKWYRRNADVPQIKLLFPPMSQWSPIDPEGVGYDAMQDAIELYLDHGDGLAGHAYWDRDEVYRVEDSWPGWLRERLPHVPYFVTEVGRRPTPENGAPGVALGHELLEFAQRTQASVVAPFILSSDAEDFEPHVLVDDDGIRAFTYVWAGRLRTAGGRPLGPPSK